MPHELIVGRNFSGRSRMLRERLAGRHEGKAFFVGPYAEAALSGLSNSVADEIEIYRAGTKAERPVFDPVDLTTFAMRKPATLSGGEQVLLALHCFSHSDYPAIGIDTALEQLDPVNRAAAIAYLGASPSDAVLIDNRIDEMPSFSSLEVADNGACTLDLAGIAIETPSRLAPTIDIKSLDFGYGANTDIFRAIDLSLAPGAAYRLVGANGAGKTTLLKLLVGVLAPRHGTLALDGVAYDPVRSGNRAFALATQNPDHQWCGATLREDIYRRRKAFGRDRAFPSEEALSTIAGKLGATSLDQPLYDLPLAARKRVSWVWPCCGAMPWIMLDEPTVGQDAPTRAGLAGVLSRLCAAGYGVMFVTHDDDFAGRMPHRQLRIADQRIAAE